jgi:hypothetical protein
MRYNISCLNDTSLRSASFYAANIQRTECDKSTTTSSFKEHVNTTHPSFTRFAAFQTSDKKVKKAKLSLQQDVKGHRVVRRHFLDNRLTDGGEVVSLMRRLSFTPQEDPWYSFLLETEMTPGS